MLKFFKSIKKSNTPKILIVDDELDFVNTIQCRLEWCHYKVITAANGKEGLEKAEAERPNLVLLDTSMPVMNGYEMLEHLKGNPDLKDIPVIMVTALCETENINKASSYGIADYVAKPPDLAELMEKIAKALQNKKSLNSV